MCLSLLMILLSNTKATFEIQFMTLAELKKVLLIKKSVYQTKNCFRIKRKVWREKNFCVTVNEKYEQLKVETGLFFECILPLNVMRSEKVYTRKLWNKRRICASCGKWCFHSNIFKNSVAFFFFIFFRKMWLTLAYFFEIASKFEIF